MADTASEDDELTVQQKLRFLLTNIKLAGEIAKVKLPGSQPALAVVGVMPEGGGQVICTFELDEFIDDIENVLDKVPHDG